MTARRCDALPWNTTAAAFVAGMVLAGLAAIGAARLDAVHDAGVSEVLSPIGCTCED
jgi:hypothetical protein